MMNLHITLYTYMLDIKHSEYNKDKIITIGKTIEKIDYRHPHN